MLTKVLKYCLNHFKTQFAGINQCCITTSNNFFFKVLVCIKQLLPTSPTLVTTSLHSLFVYGNGSDKTFKLKWQFMKNNHGESRFSLYPHCISNCIFKLSFSKAIKYLLARSPFILFAIMQLMNDLSKCALTS